MDDRYFTIVLKIPKPRRQWIRFGLRSVLILTTVVCISLGTILWWNSEPPPPSPIAILGPLTRGGQPADLGAPSDDAVINALAKSRPGDRDVLADLRHGKNVRIVKQKIADYVDPRRNYPLVGVAQRHHAHYRCKIYYEYEPSSRWFGYRTAADQPHEIVYVDCNHLHIAGDDAEANRTKLLAQSQN